MRVTPESFNSLESIRNGPGRQLKWDSVFVLPVWMEVWWREFHPEAELRLCAVREGDDIIGVAPLQISHETASFVGNADVCDYTDFVLAPGREEDFFNVLLDHLRQRGVRSLELKHLRPDSSVVTVLANMTSTGFETSCQPDAVTLEMDLPTTWEEYLSGLDSKQRHEVGRKLRRLGEMGSISYRCIDDKQAASCSMNTFLKLFAESRGDKAAFMTPQMESFFRALAAAMAGAGLLRLGVLELDTVPTAMTMSFDYNNVMYLYNSGYDPQYSYLSAGVLSKVLCIKDSIQRGRRRFEFLKGGEAYKSHLGGREVALYSCRVTLK